MNVFKTIEISASGMTAQRLRLDTIASNMANAETTRTSEGLGPYRRQVVVFEARNASGRQHSSFNQMLKKAENNIGQGVRVTQIKELDENEAPFRRVYDPSHPDADENGYVSYPNVNIVEEMVNMVNTTRSYEANAQVIEAAKSMAMQALNIGR